MKSLLICVSVHKFLITVFSFDSTYALSNSLNGIRLNKVFTSVHSRRQADALIAAGRVMVNGQVVQDMGRRVLPHVDKISLDGKKWSGWEGSVTKSNHRVGQSACDDGDEYIKFWKPVGVTSTTDRKISGNLLDALDGRFKGKGSRRILNRGSNYRDPISKRIFSVGRLDKDSSGLLLMTSDGRIPDAVLRKKWKQPKVYDVVIDKPIRPRHVEQLREGFVIRTDRIKNGRHTQLTAPTLPCQVEVSTQSPCHLVITLIEGRNRQIRVMLDTLGYHVVQLHRKEFLGISLQGLYGPGDWKRLNKKEQTILNAAVQRARDEERHSGPD